MLTHNLFSSSVVLDEICITSKQIIKKLFDLYKFFKDFSFRQKSRTTHAEDEIQEGAQQETDRCKCPKAG